MIRPIKIDSKIYKMMGQIMVSFLYKWMLFVQVMGTIEFVESGNLGHLRST